jgi:hypothetical protein
MGIGKVEESGSLSYNHNANSYMAFGVNVGGPDYEYMLFTVSGSPLFRLYNKPSIGAGVFASKLFVLDSHSLSDFDSLHTKGNLFVGGHNIGSDLTDGYGQMIVYDIADTGRRVAIGIVQESIWQFGYIQSWNGYTPQNLALNPKGGNVGVKTAFATPLSYLSINGAGISTAAFYTTNTNTTYAAYMDGTVYINGNIGIKSAAIVPLSPISIGGTGSASYNIYSKVTGNCAGYFECSNGTGVKGKTTAGGVGVLGVTEGSGGMGGFFLSEGGGGTGIAAACMDINSFAADFSANTSTSFALRTQGNVLFKNGAKSGIVTSSNNLKWCLIEGVTSATGNFDIDLPVGWSDESNYVVGFNFLMESDIDAGGLLPPLITSTINFYYLITYTSGYFSISNRGSSIDAIGKPWKLIVWYATTP